MKAAALSARVMELQWAGKYSEAIPLAQRTLAIYEKSLGLDHPNVAASLDDLAGLDELQGRYADAEPLYKRSRALLEKSLGPDHPMLRIRWTILPGFWRFKPCNVCKYATWPDRRKSRTPGRNLAAATRAAVKMS